jgi:hypothetical protein
MGEPFLRYVSVAIECARKKLFTAFDVFEARKPCGRGRFFQMALSNVIDKRIKLSIVDKF